MTRHARIIAGILAIAFAPIAYLFGASSSSSGSSGSDSCMPSYIDLSMSDLNLLGPALAALCALVGVAFLISVPFAPADPDDTEAA